MSLRIALGRRARPLIAYADGDAGEGTIEAAVFLFRRIDAAVDGAEEEIGLVADG